MIRPTPGQVVAAMKSDPLLDNWTRLFFEPYAAMLPEVLKELLDQPVTLESLVRAKIAYFDYLTTTLLPSDIERLPGVGSLSVRNNLAELVRELRHQLPSLPKILAQSGKTELEAIIGGPPLASAAVAERLQRGDLTIGELLVLQPSIILVNN